MLLRLVAAANDDPRSAIPERSKDYNSLTQRVESFSPLLLFVCCDSRYSMLLVGFVPPAEDADFHANSELSMTQKIVILALRPESCV